MGDYKIITILGVTLSGVVPFGILWLHYDHHLPTQYNVTAVNSTMSDSLEFTQHIEKTYTFPLLMLFVLVWLYSATSNDTLLEAIGLVVSKTQGADFARQKLWGKIFLSFLSKNPFQQVQLFFIHL